MCKCNHSLCILFLVVAHQSCTVFMCYVLLGGNIKVYSSDCTVTHTVVQDHTISDMVGFTCNFLQVEVKFWCCFY